MDRFVRNRLYIYYTLFYTLGYYIWLYFSKNNITSKTTGENLFLLAAPLTSSIILFFIYRRLKTKENCIWLFYSLGCFFNFLAVLANGYFYQKEVLSLGWNHLFYILQILCFLFVFIYIIRMKEENVHLTKFTFDISIIMTAAITFSWYFIIRNHQIHNIFIGLPLGDLVLVFGALVFYLGSEKLSPFKVLILSSLLIHVIANSSYFIISIMNIPFSGRLLYPLWSLSPLLLGMAGTFATQNDEESFKKKNRVLSLKNSITLRLLLPYISVILLFMTMIFQHQDSNSLIIGSAAAILLLILRHIFASLENQTLLAKYHELTEELELKIGERTEELSSINQQLLSAARKMKHMAYHDVLSGLPNRRMFLERLTTAMDEAKRNQYKLAVIFIDLDRFKNINDTLGHEFGDLLLKHVTKEMAKNVRKIDTISRQGGDEFTVLLNRIRAEEDVIPLVERIRAIVAKPINIQGQELHVSMSIGIAFYPSDGNNTKELMKNADMAMYRAKEEGRNNYKFYSKDMNKTISRKMALESGLRKALKNNEFVLNYQPQVSIQTGEIVGVEALLRWNTMEAGMVSPSQFIPVAEESGLIIPIGEWVLNHACMQGKAWHDSGKSDLIIAVNLSPVQFLHENLVEMVIKALKTTGLNPNCLELEITEGVAFTDAEAAIKNMQTLRDLGVRISIDDFGTGFSSLMYLKRFPINTLKIPKPFNQDIMASQKDKALVETIIYLGHSLGLTVVAEGIENKEQLLFLKEHHCDVVQGDLFSKPLTVTQVSALIENKKAETIS